MCQRIFMLSVATCFLLLLTKPFLLHAIPYRFLAECQPSGHITGTATKKCNTSNQSECCKANQQYNTYTCSPQVTSNTRATMTLNSFAEGGDGGDPSECDKQYHPDSELVVALSTGWYNGGSRCGKKIRINSNGQSVLAKAVDECDSTKGCDAEHAYQPPCDNNIVDASPAVWKKLGYTGNEEDYGYAQITWSDA